MMLLLLVVLLLELLGRVLGGVGHLRTSALDRPQSGMGGRYMSGLMLLRV